jgi:hypothetical protein
LSSALLGATLAVMEAALVVITACYVAAAELAKRVFYRAVG